MKYTMTRPCTQCPFRYDIPGYLREDRVYEITDALLADRTVFPCHKTIDTNTDDEDTYYVPGKDDQHCAGAMIFLMHHDAPSQMMRIVERLGLVDLNKLDMAAPVFDDQYAMAEHHGCATEAR